MGEPSLADLPAEAFKDFVLYILPGEHNSERAIELARNMKSVFMQDVNDLDSWPTWLVGVPTLVHNAEQNAYRGTACLKLLQKEKSIPCGGGAKGFCWHSDDNNDSVAPVSAPVQDSPVGHINSEDITDYINERNACFDTPADT